MPLLHSPPGIHARTLRVRVRGGYEPAELHAHVGETLRVVFSREETASCSEHVVFPAFGRSAMLPPFEDVTVELLPERAGEYEFTGQSGLLRGRLVVTDHGGEEPCRRDRSSLACAHGKRWSFSLERRYDGTAFLAVVVWLCSLPLLVLVAVPLLGWQAGGVLALVWLGVVALACFAVCVRRIRGPRASRVLRRARELDEGGV